jgi:hypothetical protein
MSELGVMICSRNRHDQLAKTLEAIDYGQPVLIFDGDKKGHARFGGRLVEPHSGTVFCRNIITSHAKTDILYSTDACTFKPGDIEKAHKRLYEKFKDGDGVIGIAQDKDHHPTGVALVGHKFICRFPSKHLFCPYYFHFAAQEIQWHAHATGSFHYAKDIVLTHDIVIDESRTEARKLKDRDKFVRDFRKKHRLIWGLSG